MLYCCRFHNPSPSLLRRKFFQREKHSAHVPTWFFLSLQPSWTIICLERTFVLQVLTSPQLWLPLACLVDNASDLVKLLGPHNRATNRTHGLGDGAVGQIMCSVRAWEGLVIVGCLTQRRKQTLAYPLEWVCSLQPTGFISTQCLSAPEEWVLGLYLFACFGFFSSLKVSQSNVWITHNPD